MERVKMVTVDEELCLGCGECLRECPNGPSTSGRHVDHGNVLCARCLHCYAVCPQGAIRLEDTGAARVNGNGHAVAADELEGFLAHRRSVRRFRDEPVPEEVVERIVRAAQYVPSGGNRHGYELTVVTDEELKDRLRAELPGIYRLRRAILDSPLLRTLLTPFVDGYTRAYLRDGEYGRRVGDLLDRLQGGEDLAFYDAPVLILVHSREQIPTPKEDSVLVAYNVVLMAQALGLGTCIVTLAQNAINSSARCKAMLGLSPQDRVHAVVVMGYSAVRYRRAVPRQAKAATWLSG